MTFDLPTTSSQFGQRRLQRFALQLPLSYRPHGETHWREGTTENISLSGVLFRVPQVLAPQTAVELRFGIPTGLGIGTEAIVTCGANVVRTVAPTGSSPQPGVAARISRYRICHGPRAGARRAPLHGGSFDSKENILLQSAMEQLPAVFLMTNSELRISACFGKGLPTQCAPPNTGRELSELFQTSDLDFPAIAAHRSALGDQPANCEFEWMGRTYEARIHPLRDAEGRVAGTTAIMLDVSARREKEEKLRRWQIQTEETLRQSDASYRSLMEGAAYGIYRCAEDGRFLEVNPALVSMLGYDSRGELFRANVNQNVFANPGECAQFARECKGQGQINGVNANWLRRNGVPITVRLSGRTVMDASEAAPCLEVMVEDVSERRQLEEQLRQAQKMEAVGRLAGGVAHDFNNLLAIIIGYGDLLANSLEEKDPRRAQAEQIKQAGDRAASLTRQLMAFSRKQVLEPKILDLNAIVGETNSMLRRLIGEDVDLVLHLAPDIGQVRADPGQIVQVIMNLAVNARDAMPKGGRLVLETSNAAINQAYAARHLTMKPGAYVLLTVTDSGMGMDAETKSHIFEPFFTTKGEGKGTGLGLATVYGIVKQSGGYIWVESEVGQGASFKVYLPRVSESVTANEAAKTSPESVAGHETCLVVEDEDAVREIARRCLEAQGYTVLQARNGFIALEICRTLSKPIHLMITDIIMPGMNGQDLARRAIALRPEMKVLYFSGYTGDTIAHQGMLHPGTAFLQKPFLPMELARKVRKVLDKPAPREDGNSGTAETPSPEEGSSSSS